MLFKNRPNTPVIRSFAFVRSLLAITMCLIFMVAANAYPAAQTWTLVWSDEFNGAVESPVDSAKWVFDIGGGWGNNELEYYTNSTRNASMDGNGNLVITAIKETLPRRNRCWYGQCQYSSARLKTVGKFEQAYGRFEARIKIPLGRVSGLHSGCSAIT